MHSRYFVLKKTAGIAALLSIFTTGVVFASEDLSESRKLYLTKCSKCHKLYDPADYEDASWEKWMVKMKKKAHLDDGQFRKIRDYLQTLRKK